MKQLLTLQGGYPRQQDYLLSLQTEMVAMGNSILGTISFDVVLQGCAVTNNNDGTVSVAAGIVYVSGQVMRFDGAVNINADGSQAFTPGAPVASGPKNFFDQNTKNVYSEVKAVVATKALNNTRQLLVGTTLLTLEGYIDARIAGSAIKGTIREFVFDLPTEQADEDAFLSKFDASGLGISPDMVDWQILNGNNGPDGTGRALIGTGTIVDPNTGTALVINSGDIGGEITHLNTKNESGKPDGLPGSLDGPRRKPADGSGENIYYLTAALQNGANATTAHNNMQPWLGVHRIRKIK